MFHKKQKKWEKFERKGESLFSKKYNTQETTAKKSLFQHK